MLSRRPSILLFFAILLVLAPAQGFCITPVRSFELKDADGRKVNFYSAITAENIEELFTGRLPPPFEFGAKAVIVYFSGQTPEVYFFALGEGKQPHDIHHVDILTEILRRHIRGLNRTTDAPDFPRVIGASQGFELQAERMDGQLYITGFDISSRITETQQHSDNLELSPQLQSWLVSHTIDRIEAGLSAFPHPKWPMDLPWTWCEKVLRR